MVHSFFSLALLIILYISCTRPKRVVFRIPYLPIVNPIMFLIPYLPIVNPIIGRTLSTEYWSRSIRAFRWGDCILIGGWAFVCALSKWHQRKALGAFVFFPARLCSSILHCIVRSAVILPIRAGPLCFRTWSNADCHCLDTPKEGYKHPHCQCRQQIILRERQLNVVGS